MKNKFNKLVLVFFIILSTACEDYLDTKPLDSATPSTFLENKKQAQTLLVGIYNMFYMGGSDLGLPFCYDNMTDNCFNPHTWEHATEFGAGTQNADSWHTQVKWDGNWRAISRANSLIRGLTNISSMTESEKSSIEAEAKFLRAYFYFDLICFYGDIPLLDENATVENPPRKNKNEVMEWIYSDVDYAIQHLPTEYGGDKANKGAALMLKMRMLQWQDKFPEVIVVCEEIEELGYKLYPDYNELFQKEVMTSNTCKEIIFKINYARDFMSSDISKLFRNWNSFNVTLQAVNAYYTANGLPIEDIVTKDGAVIFGDPAYNSDRPFENRDPRFLETILVPGGELKYAATSWYQEHFIPRNWGVETSFSVNKYVDVNLENSANEGNDKVLMRYAEVLLSWAEAENEVNGPTSVVYDKIDQIRERANMIKLSNAMPSLSKNQMREVIRNEFRVELFIEGRRWFDIRRWHIAEDVMTDALGYDNTKLTWFSNYDITEYWQYVPKVINKRSFNPERDYLWPIPNSEINSNDNPGMYQNEGYQ